MGKRFDMSRWDKKVIPISAAEKRRIDKDLIPAKKRLHIMLKQHRADQYRKKVGLAKVINATLDEMAKIMPVDRIPAVLAKISKLYVKYRTEKSKTIGVNYDRFLQTKTERDRLVGLLLANQRAFLKKVDKMPRAEAEKALSHSLDPAGLIGKRFWFTRTIDPRKLFPVQEMPDGALPDYDKRKKKQ